MFGGKRATRRQTVHTRDSSPAVRRQPDHLNHFVEQYLETAICSSFDENGEPLDRRYDIPAFTAKALSSARKDAKKFIAENRLSIASWPGGETDGYAQAGHDFWLTRNRHGAGFWDGDWPNGEATRLTNAAHAFREIDVEVYRGRLHFLP